MREEFKTASNIVLSLQANLTRRRYRLRVGVVAKPVVTSSGAQTTPALYPDLSSDLIGALANAWILSLRMREIRPRVRGRTLRG